MIEILIYKNENGNLGMFIGHYNMPCVPRVGEFIFATKKIYEVVEIRYLIDGPRQGGFNWVDVLVNVHH